MIQSYKSVREVVLFLLLIASASLAAGTRELHRDVNAQAIEKDGTIWIGSYEYIMSSSDTGWINHDSIVDEITDIAIANDGTKWIGHRGGVTSFNGTNLTRYTTSDGLISYDVRTIAIDNSGTVWIGTSKGISKFDGTTWTGYSTANSDLPDNQINSLHIDHNGVVWVGSGGDLSSFDGTTWTIYNYTSTNGVHVYSTRSITQAPNRTIWFGTYHNGVCSFDGTTWKKYNTTDGLVHNQITDIAIAQDGTKWFGTQNGISKLDGTTWTNYRTELADPVSPRDDNINDISVGIDGNIWIGTNRGLYWSDNLYESKLNSALPQIEVDDAVGTVVGNLSTSRFITAETGVVYTFLTGSDLFEIVNDTVKTKRALTSADNMLQARVERSKAGEKNTVDIAIPVHH